MRIPKSVLSFLALWMLALNTANGKTEPKTASDSLKLDSSDQGFRLSKAGKPILLYLRKPSTESSKHPSHYSRSGYIHLSFPLPARS